MKYCENCRSFYSDDAAACPKCGIDDEKAKAEEIASGEAEHKRVVLDWLWLLIGVPLLIGLVYLFVYIIKYLGH